MKNKHCRRLLHLLVALTVLALLALPSVFASEITIEVNADAQTITIPSGLSVTTDQIAAVDGYDSGYTIQFSGGRIIGGTSTLPNPVEITDQTSTIYGGSFSGTVTLVRGQRSSLNGGTFSGPVIVEGGLKIIAGTTHLTHTATLDTTNASYLHIGGSTIIDCDVDLHATSSAYVSGGTFNDWVTVGTNGMIGGGTFNAPVINNNIIKAGEFVSNVTNNGTIEGGTFLHNVENNGTIKGGDFTGSVTNNGTVEGGVFKGRVELVQGKVTGGDFSGYVGVGNHTKITGGNYSGTVELYNRATINGGTVSGKLLLGALGYAEGNVYLTETASVEATTSSVCGMAGGTYDCDITAEKQIAIFDGTFNGNVTSNFFIYGGTFQCSVENNGTVKDGDFTGPVTNNGTIEDGTFSGSVKNNGTIKGGTFNGNVENNGTIEGGTFSGNVVNNGTIKGGEFTNTSFVSIDDYGEYIYGGTFDGTVKVSYGSISGGTVNGKLVLTNLGFAMGSVHLTKSATISVENSGLSGIVGGIYDCDFIVKGNFHISGGVFNGKVTNYSYISGGTFNGGVENGASGKICAITPDTDYPEGNAPVLNCEVTNNGEIYATVFGENFSVTGTGKTYAVVTLVREIKVGETVTVIKTVSYRDFLYNANAAQALDAYAKAGGKLCHWYNYVDGKATDLTEGQTISADPAKNVFLQVNYINGLAQFRLDGTGKYDFRMLVECDQSYVLDCQSIQLLLTFRIAGNTIKVNSPVTTQLFTSVIAKGEVVEAQEGYALTGLNVYGIDFASGATVEARVVLTLADGSTVECNIGTLSLPESADSSIFEA